MNLEFIEPDELPLPPSEIRFRNIQADLLSDHRRVRLTISITAFEKPPNIEIEAFDPGGLQVSSTSVIGIPGVQTSLTLHLRGELGGGEYRLHFSLGYPDADPVDRKEISLQIPEPGNPLEGNA